RDPQPVSGPALAEEREMQADPVVLPGRGARFGQQVLQPFLAVRRQPVDDLGTSAGALPGLPAVPGLPRDTGRAGAGRYVFSDQALREQVLQAWVQRAVSPRAERAEQGAEPLAQLVAVQGGLVQQAEHSELEHARPVTAHRCCDLPAAYDP